MATRNLVPRADSEGGIGTSIKKWATGYINTLVVSTINALTIAAQATGFTISGGTSSRTLTVDATVSTSALAPLNSPSLVTPALGTPASGVLTNCTSATQSARDGSTKLATDAYVDAGDTVILQNSQTVDYTCVIGDAGKHIYQTVASKTITIPANGSVAYPTGTVLTFINWSSGTMSIAITSDTMTLANSATTGTRTLATHGLATAIKLTSTTWVISGVGLT